MVYHTPYIYHFSHSGWKSIVFPPLSKYEKSRILSDERYFTAKKETNYMSIP